MGPLIPALLVAVAALFGVTWAYVLRTRAAFPPVGRFVSAGGARLHVEVRGRGPALVLVHGAAGVLQDFPEALRASLARDHTVISFDRAGHGWSGRDRRRLDLATNLAQLRAALRELGHARAIIAGHSYGALVGLQWALDAPEEVEAVVALAPAAFPYAHAARFGMLPVIAPGLGHLLSWTLLVPVGLPLSRLVRDRAWWPQRPPVGPGGPSRAFSFMPSQFRAFAENAQAVWHESGALSRRYGSARVPLVIVAGEGDRVTPIARHARPLAGAWSGPTRLVLLPDGGHMLLRSHAEAVAEGIRTAGALARSAETRGA